MTDRAAAPGIKLHTVFLNSAHFKHLTDPLLPKRAKVVEDAGNADLVVSVAISPEGLAAVRARISNDPNDPTSRYEYSLELIALFSADPRTPNMPLREYALHHGPGLLFPFAREAVANLTARGQFGAVWLNPLNLLQIVQSSAVDGAWKEPGLKKGRVPGKKPRRASKRPARGKKR